jgi:hypothetical protein
VKFDAGISALLYNSLYTLDMIDSSHFFIKKFVFSFILILFFFTGAASISLFAQRL